MIEDSKEKTNNEDEKIYKFENKNIKKRKRSISNYPSSSKNIKEKRNKKIFILMTILIIIIIFIILFLILFFILKKRKKTNEMNKEKNNNKNDDNQKDNYDYENDNNKYNEIISIYDSNSIKIENYSDNDINSSDLKCKKEDENCLICNLDECISCNPGYDLINKTCIKYSFKAIYKSESDNENINL